MSKRQQRTRQKELRHARSGKRLAVGGGVALAASLISGSAAEANTYTVTNTSDGASPGPVGSLRKAIYDSENHAGANTIVFSSGLSGTITLTSGELYVTNNPVNITGPGARNLTISGNNNSRIFDFKYAGPDTISGLTLTGGKAGTGGAVYSYGSKVTLSQDTISGNTATTKGGGVDGAYKSGTSLTIDHSTISGNTAPHGGGAYAYEYASLTITDSTIAGNHATTNRGGGIEAVGSTSGQPSVSIVDSTISGNTASNTSSGRGGGVAAHEGNVAVKNSIISGNTAAKSNPDIYNYIYITGSSSYGSDVSAQFSLIQNNAKVPINDPVGGSDIFGKDPLLGPLQNNGGPTNTMAPSPSSPVIDQGAKFMLTTDQRGLTRPVDIQGIPNSAATGADGSDMGAVELQLTDFPPAVSSLSPTSGPAGTPVVLSGRFFSGATQVLFGSTPATFTINGDQQITATAPTGTGAVDVRVITPGGESAVVAGDRFTFMAPPVIPAPLSCQLSVLSRTATVRSGLGARRSQATQSPSVSVSCNQDASLFLSATLTARKRRHGRKLKTKTFELPLVTDSVHANVPRTFNLALPRGALHALKRGAHEVVVLNLTAFNANGTSTARAFILRLLRAP